MNTKLNPYLNFKDNTRQAMEFYETVFGGKLQMSTFKDFHASQDPAEDDLIMHADLQADNGIALMASDTPPPHGVPARYELQHVPQRRQREGAAGLLH